MKTRKEVSGEVNKLLGLSEDHFNDLKSRIIAPGKLQETFVAFANADGGDLWIGVEDSKTKGERMHGFKTVEEANDIFKTLLELTVPAVENVDSEFIDFGNKGLVLHMSIPKSPKVHYTSNGDCFIRINASKTKIRGERITELGYAKGAFVYEKQAVDISSIEDMEDSNSLNSYMARIASKLPVEAFLRKQRLLTKKDSEMKPNVACVLLFDDEPQATLDTRCAIKIYRLLTSESEYKRELLKEPPRTINGHIENQIIRAIEVVNELLKDASIEEEGKMKKIIIPKKSIHEILVNAVIHRDYSLNDDVHIRIYDNRIEFISPGKLPGYITKSNIYDERFSRNPNIVRLLHNLTDPVNHDIGEGLDTARNEMKKAGLVAPDIDELDNSVKVTLKYKRIASLEDIIMKFFDEYPSEYVTNKKIRELSGEDDVNKVKKAFQRLRRLKKIEIVNKNESAFNYSYRRLINIQE